MIGLKDNSVLLAIPPKCGYQGLLNTLVFHLKIATKVLPEHGWTIHPEYSKRVLFIRDPLERWISYYWFIKTQQSSKATRHYDTFYKFTKYLTNYKGNAIQAVGLHRWEEFEPSLIIRQEDIEEQWENIFPVGTLGRYQKTSKHPTKKRRSIVQTLTHSGVFPGFINLLSEEYRFLKDHYSFLHTKNTLRNF